MQKLAQYCAVSATAAALFTLTGCGGSATPSAPAVPSVHNEWTWVSGSNRTDQSGSYGTQDVAAPGNTPGARAYAASSSDKSGNLWLFGGFGGGATGAFGDLNDLWKYSNGEWTWVSGSNQTEQAGVYGTKGVPAQNNVPGARYQAASWIDPQGDFWVFGGLGIDSNGARGDLNDLWKFSNGQWTWMTGSTDESDGSKYPYLQGAGVYGTLGVPNPNNTPGARTSANSWTDSSGNLWLFGGDGWDSTGMLRFLNDLWRYSAGEWTWMAGSNLAQQPGVYGTQGTPAPGNTPGSRFGASSWTDSAGNLWLFSGEGASSAGVYCPADPCTLNDLWKYSAGGGWAWMAGTNEYNQVGVYGTQGTPAPGNIPGGRTSAASFTDTAGNFWLFGGYGMGSTLVFGDLNDLWKFSDGQWTWTSGANLPAQTGAYGAQGKPAAANVPGCRDGAVGWGDTSGKAWIFGGEQTFCLNGDDFNDLWVYQP